MKFRQNQWGYFFGGLSLIAQGVYLLIFLLFACSLCIGALGCIVKKGENLTGNGNLVITVQCLQREDQKLTEEDVKRTLDIIKRRLQAKYTKRIKLNLKGEDLFDIVIPGGQRLDINEIKRKIETRAMFEFVDPKREFLEKGADASGLDVIVSSKHLLRARLSSDSSMDKPNILSLLGKLFHKEGKKTDKLNILLSIDEEGNKKISNFTMRNIGYYLALSMDKKVIYCPKIMSAVFDNTLQITGFTHDEAEEMATFLNAGYLPIDVIVLETH